MTKLSRYEHWVFLFLLLFLAASLSWFFMQGQEQQLTRVAVDRPNTATALTPPPVQNPAPGMLAGERLNINTASAADLTRLPGIGEVRAEAICTYRETVAAFVQPEDIQNVSGIGVKTFEKLAPYIRVSD